MTLKKDPSMALGKRFWVASKDPPAKGKSREATRVFAQLKGSIPPAGFSSRFVSPVEMPTFQENSRIKFQ